MEYTNLFFESDSQVIPFRNVKHVSGNYIYFVTGDSSYATFDGRSIPKEQMDSYKRWVNSNSDLNYIRREY